MFKLFCFPTDLLHIWTHDRYGKGACRDGARFLNFDVGWQWEGSKIRFSRLWPCFSTDLLQIWWIHGHGIGALYHVKKTSWRNDVVTLWRKNVHFGGFWATMAVFFNRFASYLVQTCAWYRRIASCEKIRHDVTTSWRYDVKTPILGFFGSLWPCFSTDLLQIW